MAGAVELLPGQFNTALKDKDSYIHCGISSSGNSSEADRRSVLSGFIRNNRMESPSFCGMYLQSSVKIIFVENS